MSMIEFWKGMVYDVDTAQLVSQSIPVKGKQYQNPCRFMEIYGNLTEKEFSYRQIKEKYPTHFAVTNIFLPSIPGVDVLLGENVYQPPFTWKDCLPMSLAVNFTYNTNAIYRILSNLVEGGLIPKQRLPQLLDEACLMLAYVYKSQDHFIMRNMNNNLNMFFISKTIQELVGTDIYDCNMQEITLTERSLRYSLGLVREHCKYDIPQQMAMALGKGVAFIEKHLSGYALSNDSIRSINHRSYAYYERPLPIDHRALLIEKVARADEEGQGISMCAILDDTSETVDDLLWMQSLIKKFKTFKVNLLVNTAQVSINFSAVMLETVLENHHFKALRESIDKQLFIYKTYCPLISFQRNFLTSGACEVIDKSDFVFVKGLNFFETCQIITKPTFYAFVVYGPTSRLYTGLKDYDAVFAYLPEGFAGYQHSNKESEIRTLKELTA